MRFSKGTRKSLRNNPRKQVEISYVLVVKSCLVGDSMGLCSCTKAEDEIPGVILEIASVFKEIWSDSFLLAC